MITMLASGLWHGANWTYVLWGGLHGIYQIAERELQGGGSRVIARIVGTREGSFSARLWKGCRTFILFSFATIIFRAPDIRSAGIYIKRMFTRWNPDRIFNVYNVLYDMGLNGREFNLLLACLVCWLLIEAACRWKDVRFSAILAEQSFLFKWGVVIGLVVSIYLFGVYGTSYSAQQFIYFQF